MAILEGTIKFTGKLGNISFYKLPGSDKIIMRAGNGPSREKIKNSPRFARTRENISEFSACSACSNKIRMALRIALPLINIPCHNQLVSVLRKIVDNDNCGKRGKRPIRFSQYANRLSGFELVPQRPLFEVLTYTPSFSSEENNSVVTFSMPGFNPNIHLQNRNGSLYYRFIGVVLSLPDFIYSAGNKKYDWENKQEPEVVTTFSGWFLYDNKNRDMLLQLLLPANLTLPHAKVRKLLILGMEFGVMADSGISGIWKTFRGKVISAG
jgi:hypothetical protein